MLEAIAKDYEGSNYKVLSTHYVYESDSSGENEYIFASVLLDMTDNEICVYFDSVILDYWSSGSFTIETTDINPMPLEMVEFVQTLDLKALKILYGVE